VNSDASDEILTYWLIPAEPARGYFQSLIRDLGERFEAPAFEPHVTLYTTGASGENPAEVLATAVANVRQPRLSIAGVDFSDEFTKTLFVQMRPDPGVNELSNKLRRASVSQREDELNPHLSLIYKRMPDDTKIEIRNSLRLPFEEVQFDSVKAIISPATIKTREDVEAWRVVATWKLP
jgi:2'-5' RNA ligase